jgi:hypothetical protein
MIHRAAHFHYHHDSHPVFERGPVKAFQGHGQPVHSFRDAHGLLHIDHGFYRDHSGVWRDHLGHWRGTDGLWRDATGTVITLNDAIAAAIGTVEANLTSEPVVVLPVELDTPVASSVPPPVITAPPIVAPPIPPPGYPQPIQYVPVPVPPVPVPQPVIEWPGWWHGGWPSGWHGGYHPGGGWHGGGFYSRR